MKTISLNALVDAVQPAAAANAAALQARLDDLTKPQGSLGRLEDVALRLALLLGDPPPALRRRTVLVFAADHGVACAGVSAYPQAVTAQMCRTIADGRAAICAIARAVNARVTLVDVGVASDVPAHPAIVDRRIRNGTADLSEGAALSPEETAAAILCGASIVQDGLTDTDVFALGELGIANTTAAAALTAALLDVDPATVVGRGTGLDDAGLERKRRAVHRAVERLASRRRTHPLDVLSEVGGLEIAALVGAMLAAAAAGRPIVLDGFIVGAAALVAERLTPYARDAMFAAHRSAEPGHVAQLRALRLDPLLDLDLRLGEGTGAALALPVLEAAAGVLREMASFGTAGVSRRTADG